VNLRWRLSIMVGLLLLTMVTLVSVTAYVTTDRRLHEEVDASLDERANSLRVLVGRNPRGRPGGVGGAGPDGSAGRSVLPPTSNLSQLLDDEGRIEETVGDVALPVDPLDRALARNGGTRYLRTERIAGEPYRIETVPLRLGGAVQVARELGPTEETLGSLRRRYLASSALVALLGAILGWLLASWITRPVAATCSAATGRLDTDVDTNVPGGKHDETARLARSFASMLAALRESRARQRQLVQDASHELRTPVTSIRTNVDVLRRHPYLEPAERGKVLDDVNSELTQVTAMVDELVVLASGDGELDEAEGPVRLDQLVHDLAERTHRRTGRMVATEVDQSTVWGSARGLERAISNLLDNACKFSPAGTPLDVTVKAGVVTVRDRGRGIDDADLPHVFDRFYRATTARTEPGSGLGLAIVDQVAQRHGGRAFAMNHPEGGAMVGFGVPLADGSR
jgi:two-component system, OmpR family, sensor histidine kinase MprB